jgi:hypothetical protein
MPKASPHHQSEDSCGISEFDVMFAARNFWFWLGASDEHIPHGSVRSEHKARAKKDGGKFTANRTPHSSNDNGNPS